MPLDEKQIAEAKRSGARVRGLGGAALRPIDPPKPKADPEAPARLLLGALRELVASVETALSKRAEPASITFKPEITVRPEITVEQAPRPLRKIKFRVTERDGKNIVAFEAEEYEIKP